MSIGQLMIECRTKRTSVRTDETITKFKTPFEVVPEMVLAVRFHCLSANLPQSV